MGEFDQHEGEAQTIVNLADAAMHMYRAAIDSLPFPEDKKFQKALLDATHIDRLNIGPIPTIKLDWLQPHEGNIVDFLFRARAYQLPKERLAGLARAT